MIFPVSLEGPDAAARDEGIALAISEERDAADGPSQLTESVTEKVIMPSNAEYEVEQPDES